MNAILQPFVTFFKMALEFFFQYVHNYGVAIILLTVSVRIILLPLTITQTRNMIQMQRIQPKLKELQQKYKDDKEKLQKELMAFYKEHNVNPLAGCFPLLLQMPIFFALYRVLIDYPNLKGESFLWIKNLAVADPYYILIILMVGTTLLTSLQTMTDPKQRIMKKQVNLQQKKNKKEEVRKEGKMAEIKEDVIVSGSNVEEAVAKGAAKL